jgi:ribosomal protein L29
MSDNDIRDIALAHMTIEQQGQRIADLEKQLADIRFLIQHPRGWVIRTKKENQSLKQQLSDLTVQLSASKAELAKWKLEWKTGKPQKDGWYWITTGHQSGPQLASYIPEDEAFQLVRKRYWLQRKDVKWAGPIQPPEEEV